MNGMDWSAETEDSKKEVLLGQLGRGRVDEMIRVFQIRDTFMLHVCSLRVCVAKPARSSNKRCALTQFKQERRTTTKSATAAAKEERHKVARASAAKNCLLHECLVDFTFFLCSLQAHVRCRPRRLQPPLHQFEAHHGYYSKHRETDKDSTHNAVHRCC